MRASSRYLKNFLSEPMRITLPLFRLRMARSTILIQSSSPGLHSLFVVGTTSASCRITLDFSGPIGFWATCTPYCCAPCLPNRASSSIVLRAVRSVPPLPSPVPASSTVWMMPLRVGIVLRRRLGCAQPGTVTRDCQKRTATSASL